MKTPIQLSLLESLIVYPCEDDPMGGVMIKKVHKSSSTPYEFTEHTYLCPEQVRALIFALEQAAEAAQMADRRGGRTIVIADPLDTVTGRTAVYSSSLKSFDFWEDLSGGCLDAPTCILAGGCWFLPVVGMADSMGRSRA